MTHSAFNLFIKSKMTEACENAYLHQVPDNGIGLWYTSHRPIGLSADSSGGTHYMHRSVANRRPILSMLHNFRWPIIADRKHTVKFREPNECIP